ncbi:hypothetical protein [Desulfogranum japonicum]|uniref:hypothetical protein n=1 Tax=Desulfogranum japonicum TaxID=231447 RepID=UPI000425AB87|nr:hypothetical protein [Desulfogranum japonicum]
MGVDTKRLPIDNREYELLEVRENGKLYNKETGKLLTRNKVKVAILLVLCCLVAFGIYFYFNSTKGKEQVQSVLHKTLHTKKAYVIILRNGDAFVAAHYEEKGSSLFFVDKDNQMHEVPQTDIMQIREAVMED